MKTASDYRIGQTVENSYGARGKVSRINGGTLTVSYSDRGGTWTSTHNEAWFRKYPDMLRIVVERRPMRGAACVGKKAAGRLLDGREYNEFPAAPTAETRAA